MNAKQLLARDPKLLRETELSGLVVDVARLGGWQLRYHTWSAQKSPRGFPDWCFCKPPRLVFAELKSQDGPVRPEQRAWLDALSDVPGIEVYLWRPSDYEEIVTVLTGKAPA